MDLFTHVQTFQMLKYTKIYPPPDSNTGHSKGICVPRHYVDQIDTENMYTLYVRRST